jgi:hypothetical protein
MDAEYNQRGLLDLMSNVEEQMDNWVDHYNSLMQKGTVADKKVSSTELLSHSLTLIYVSVIRGYVSLYLTSSYLNTVT